MVLELLTPVAGWALGKAADTVWDTATDRVKTTLQRTDVERAIKAGLEAVREWEASLPPQELLLKACDDKQKQQFLEQVFSDAGVVEQLQRPLLGQGELDAAFLKAYFAAVAQNTNVKLTTESLPQWIEIFSRTYFEKTALFIKYQVARQSYLKQLANWYDDVKFLGISVASQEAEKSEKLLQIFVMPDVKERAELLRSPVIYSKATDIPGANFHDYVGGLAIEANSAAKQSMLLQDQRHMAALLKQEGKTFLAGELLKQSHSHRCVVLGAPGSGKTTLMSYFAVALASSSGNDKRLGLGTDYLPILVRIRDWLRSPKENLLDYVRSFAIDKLAVKDLPAGFFEHWLEAGKALILLDGLDEVASESRRDEVVNQIECFLQHEHYRQNPAIITSRPAGYKQAYFRTEEFPHYDLQPFDDTKISQFLENWYSSRFDDPEESKRWQKSLKQALSGRDRIQVLAKNPLLLTIIALIHRYEAYLPRDRHQLYNRAVETLLTNWDVGKDLSYKWPLEYLRRDTLRRMMERIAYWIHSYGSAGDADGGTLIDREELINQVSGFITEETGIKRYEATEEAKRFLEFIRNRTGLLNEQGQDCYAFVHKTFQEYLTAEDIRYQQLEEGFEIVQNHINDHLHNPHWEEVLLLLIAQQPKKRVAQILKQVLEFDAPYEQWLHRNMFFAAYCLSENVQLTELEIIDQILGSLAEFEVSKSPLISARLRNQSRRCLCNLGETSFQNTALRILESQIENVDPIQLQLFRVALGKESAAIEALLKLLSDDDSDMRSAAANALGEIGNASEIVVTALLERFNDDDSEVRGMAAYALGEIGETLEVVIKALLGLFNDDDPEVRDIAAHALGKLGNASEDVVIELLKRLSDDSEARSMAAYALGQLGNTSEAVVTELLERLSDSDSVTRSMAAYALGEIGETSERVTTVLLEQLNDNDAQVRTIAVSALYSLENTSEVVVSALLERLSDSDSDVRSMTAYTLGQLGKTSEHVVKELLRQLSNDHSEVRSTAISALSELGNDSEVVVTALLGQLSDDDAQVCRMAISALGQLGSASEVVVTALLGQLDDDDVQVRRVAISALGELGNDSEVVVKALLGELSNDEAEVRRAAVSALGELGNNSEVVVTSLLGQLSDDSRHTRYIAVYALSQLCKKSTNITPQIAAWVERNQDEKHVGHGIDVLWELVTE